MLQRGRRSLRRTICPLDVKAKVRILLRFQLFIDATVEILMVVRRTTRS